MYITFSQFLENKNEENMSQVKKGIIAGASGALIALGGCSGSDCLDKTQPQTQQAEPTFSKSSEEIEFQIQKYKKRQEEIKRQEKIKKQQEIEKIKERIRRQRQNPGPQKPISTNGT